MIHTVSTCGRRQRHTSAACIATRRPASTGHGTARYRDTGTARYRDTGTAARPSGPARHNRGVTADHYFSTDPATPLRSNDVEFTVAGRTFQLTAASGVFSGGRLDPGTGVLLRKAVLPGPRGGRYLDLGCGYGPIACVLAATSPRAEVHAVDVNSRALDLVRRNALAAGVADQVTVSTPDEVPAELTFDEIWSTPPIRIGKDGLHDLLRRWLPRLGPDGVAWLVVARNLGADSLHRWLEGEGWRVIRQSSQQGYRVLRVTRAG